MPGEREIEEFSRFALTLYALRKLNAICRGRGLGRYFEETRGRSRVLLTAKLPTRSIQNMATRKKAKGKSKAKQAKGKTKERKAPARKPVARKKAAKKAPVRRVPPKAKKPAARRAVAAKPVPAGPVVKPPPGERIGVVTHYFNQLSVAVVKVESGTLRVGDNIHFRGHTTDFGQRIESLQVNHAPVAAVGPRDDFGLKVREHVRENDVVYKVT